jgi:hypothetical protein
MWRRAVLILVLLPGVEMAMVGGVVFWGFGLAFGFQALRTAIRRELSLLPLLAVGLVSLLLAGLAAVAVCWLLRWLTRWLISDAQTIGASSPAQPV